MNFQKQLANQALHGHEVEQKSSVFESPTDSSNDYRKVLCEDIDQVCWLIERGILSYKTKDEVVTFLVNRYKIEPGFTTLVWQRLEKENAKFFKAYYVRLKLIKQISIFNQLLEMQYRLMNNREPHSAMTPSMQNGLQHMPLNSSVGYPTHMGVPSLGCFYPIQLNTGNIGTAGGINQDMAVSCPSTESNGQFSFTPDQILQMSIDETFSPNLHSTEGLPFVPCDGNGISMYNPSSYLSADITNCKDLGALRDNSSSPFFHSDMDTGLDSPDLCDIVDDVMLTPYKENRRP